MSITLGATPTSRSLWSQTKGTSTDWPSMLISSTGQIGPGGQCCAPTNILAATSRCCEQTYRISPWELSPLPGIQTTVSIYATDESCGNVRDRGTPIARERGVFIHRWSVLICSKKWMKRNRKKPKALLPTGNNVSSMNPFQIQTKLYFVENNYRLINRTRCEVNVK